MKQDLQVLGVRVDKVSIGEATATVIKWVRALSGKRFITTPNVEIIMAAQKDQEFKEILNRSDMNIPDSARFGWADRISREKNPVKKLVLWPGFLLPTLFKEDFSVVTGTDLMENLCGKADDYGFTIGLLGGEKGVAKETAECLKKKFPRLKISFFGEGGRINNQGEQTDTQLPEINSEILFVAFGHIKQEKWIYKNMSKVNSKVFIGVGGAFDYLSGRVPRAPKLVRSLGFEWLFRLIVQPWRIKRFGALLQFLFSL